MKQNKAILFLIIIISSCGNSTTNKVERSGEPIVYQTTEDDTEMNEAIHKAKETFGQFLDALKSDNPDYGFFSVKTQFVSIKGNEHIWLTNLFLMDKNYYGIVDNLPLSTTEVQLGDTIPIDKENISDWIYFDKDEMQGGYTVRLLRTRMNPEERKLFDEEIRLEVIACP